MNNGIRFYGAVVSGGIDGDGFQFVIGDIYLPQRNRWLKANSPDVHKLSGNLDALKASKNFAFYTQSENKSRSTNRGAQFLKDSIENRQSDKPLAIKVIADTNGGSLIVPVVNWRSQ